MTETWASHDNAGGAWDSAGIRERYGPELLSNTMTCS